MYLESKTERTFGIACLEKKLFFNRKYRFFRLLFAYYIFKNIELSSGQGVGSKVNQNRYEVSHGYLECKTEKFFGIACLEKKFIFQSEISTF